MLADTNSEMSILLSVNTTLDGSIMHVVSTNEFYIQSQENLKQLIDHQCIIKTLANLSVNMDFKSIRGQPAHQVGDICLAKYLCDSTWYRGVVMKVNVVQQLDEGYSYDVFFLLIMAILSPRCLAVLYCQCNVCEMLLNAQKKTALKMISCP